MHICGIDFPEALLASQKDGNLAVFGGAGVSIPPPSNYPDFKDLANQVAGGVLTRGADEPIDHFLGKLADRDMRVHQIVKKILSDPESKPNGMHFDLLKLFPSHDTLRLVTTNFDTHFSAAAAEVFPNGNPIEIHYAPALPLGDSFSGIVYLHGCVEKPSERLVLTDSDFGRAYLTHGWARVFLQKLFERYTVLFVGYGHDDPVMNYLARGLPPPSGASRRYALTGAGNEQSWTYRGVVPITYRQAAGTHPHADLRSALGAWAMRVRLGALQQEQRIKSIVELPPPVDLEDSDYIESALSEPVTTRFFTRHANTVAWLKWVEDKRFLNRLFDPRAVLTEVDGELGQWFAEQFACEYLGESLSVLRRLGGCFSAYLWTVVARRLARPAPNRPSSQALRRWLTVLLNDPPPGTNADSLEYLSAALVFPEDTVAALLLFEYLSRPIFRLGDEFWSKVQQVGSGEDVSFKVVTRGGGFWLNHFWTKLLSPNLAAFVDSLELIVTSHLEQARLFSRAETDATWDVLSVSRSRIEQLDGGLHGNGFGVLVDVAFAVMQWEVQHRSSRSDALIDRWLAASSLLLKRLAIFGVALSKHWTADRKLAWLVGNELLYKTDLKREVLAVLREAYSQASAEARHAVLEQACQGHRHTPEGHEAAASYETYNLLYWLRESDPQCALAKDAFDALQAAHPEFAEPEHPDSDVDSGGAWVGWQSPRTVEDLLAKTPNDQIDYLLSFNSETPFGPSRGGLLETVRNAAIRDFHWGRQLAAELETRKAWETDLWPSIIRSWTGTELSDEQWKEILTFLDGADKLHSSFVFEIASLLEEGIKKNSHPTPDSCLGVAVDLSKRLWVVLCAKVDGAPEKVKHPDWMFLALNHPAGRITLFWLSWLVRKHKQPAGNSQGMPEEIRKVLEPVLAEPVYAAELARVLLASQLNFLWNVDEVWTKEHVLPLFDWSVDGKRAIQAFHGFFTWGRQTENLAPYLLPQYEKAFDHLLDLGELRGRFVEYLAGLALASSINPMKHGWLKRFVAVSTLEDRVRWASGVCAMLRDSVDEARVLAWNSWIREYWSQRVLGVPLPLDSLELGEMVEWTMQLGPSFPEAVEAVWIGPKFELKNSPLLSELADNELSKRHPTPAAKLLLRVLQNTQVAPYDLDKVEETVRRVAPLQAPSDTLSDICNELARLGYPDAAKLQTWLQGGNFQ